MIVRQEICDADIMMSWSFILHQHINGIPLPNIAKKYNGTLNPNPKP